MTYITVHYRDGKAKIKSHGRGLQLQHWGHPPYVGQRGGGTTRPDQLTSAILGDPASGRAGCTMIRGTG